MSGAAARTGGFSNKEDIRKHLKKKEVDDYKKPQPN